ncbi:NAD(P)H-binding protein [compost metagenome]|uniref:NADH-flavin reductase n=1 Tax=Pseudomonas jinjuensis TaxID=198616 RepID=A0A1H0CZ84_9PSED|nr:NAD(P)H-binding protein [Pseudomonas jinjuensis]SDN63227.1 Putative NADH-flavin reductase [Pseudomonas jinjuensis]
MHNLESETFKIGLFQPESSLGQALLAEALHRQLEVSALVDDLNAMPARPGLRCKIGRLDDARAVSESVAGLDALIVGFSPDLPGSWLCPAIEALIDGLVRAEVPRLLLVADWTWLDRPADPAEADLARRLQRTLQASEVDWTLVQIPEVQEGFAVDDFAGPEQQPLALDSAHEMALRYAAAMLDEIQLGLHKRQRIRLLA